MLICRLIGLLILGVAATSAWAAQGKRVALVVGNGAYQYTAPLSNPTNDAADLGAALKRLGFEVIEGRDLDESGMRRTIKRFAELLTGADVGLFFYAGHGLQVAGHNYLVPVDARLENAAGLDFELIRLDVVHRTMERETKTNVIFLDACRDNPLSRNLARSMGTRSSQIGKGLAVVESGVGTLISFSTQPGNVALDGEGRNSPYAASLIKQIGNPKEDLSTLLIQVRNEVMASTRDQQIPWEHSALRSKFYFAGVPPPPEPAKPAELSPVYGAELAAQTRELRKALEEARLAREAAKAAEEQRLAALKAAESANAAAEEALARKREAQTATTDPTKLASLPKIEKPQTSNGFVGIWTIAWDRGPGCLQRGGGTFTMSVTLDGTVMFKGGVAGHVSDAGAASWRMPAAGDGAPVHYQGTLDDTTGSGKFARVDGKCVGSFTAKRN